MEFTAIFYTRQYFDSWLLGFCLRCCKFCVFTFFLAQLWPRRLVKLNLLEWWYHSYLKPKQRVWRVSLVIVTPQKHWFAPGWNIWINLSWCSSLANWSSGFPFLFQQLKHAPLAGSKHPAGAYNPHTGASLQTFVVLLCWKRQYCSCTPNGPSNSMLCILRNSDRFWRECQKLTWIGNLKFRYNGVSINGGTPIAGWLDDGWGYPCDSGNLHIRWQKWAVSNMYFTTWSIGFRPKAIWIWKVEPPISLNSIGLKPHCPQWNGGFPK